MGHDVEILLRRKRKPTGALEMTVVRDGHRLIVARDDDAAGRLLFPLCRLSGDELRWALVELDAPCRRDPRVRDALLAVLEYDEQHGCAHARPGPLAAVVGRTRRR